MRVLLWHVHGSWPTAFVQGDHEYVVPVIPDRTADGVGRARTWDRTLEDVASGAAGRAVRDGRAHPTTKAVTR